MPLSTRLNNDDEMLQRMETDLATKCSAAMTAAGVTANVHGVFSLDDLEKKGENDLCNKIAVGVGYAGAENRLEARSGRQGDAGGGQAIALMDALFHVLLVVPVGEDCEERYDATKLLTVLRRRVHGTKVDGDSSSRHWAWVKEFPNIEQSSDTLLYYSQVWRASIPMVSMQVAVTP
jgi:hypothetical protein